MTAVMSPPAHSYLETARGLLPLIRAEAAAAESQGHMTDAVVEAFRASGLQQMLVTEDLGGGGHELPAMLPVAELLASADAASGWSLMFAMMGPTFGQLLPRDSYEAIFSKEHASITGALAPTGVAADATDGGYIVSGKSSYNSAHRFASHLFFGGVVRRNGQVNFTDGTPELRGFVVPKSEVTIIPNWPASAMVATESDDAVIDKVFVRDEFSFPFVGAVSAWREGAARTMPLLSMLGVGLGSIAVGAARGCLDCFRETAVSKIPAGGMTRLADQAGAQIAFAEAEGTWMAAEALLQNSARDAWAKAAGGDAFGPLDMARLRLGTVTATRLSKRAIELVRDYSGMSVVLRGSPMERLARDAGAVTQHVAVAAQRYENCGRVLLGLAPNGPML